MNFLLHKLFLEDDFYCSSTIQIYGDSFKHIKALRLVKGDKIIVCDGRMNDYFCSIQNIYNDRAILSVNEVKESQTEPNKKVFLFQALPKADKFEFVVQKAVELGVNKIIPVISEHCDIKNPPGINKLIRWRKISKSAAEQSGRGIIPEITEPMNFEMAVVFSKNLDMNIIAHEKSNCSIKKFSFKKDSIGIFIGPEGGFSQSEIEFADLNKINLISLGKRILRAETASLFLLSLIVFQLEL